MRHGGVEDKIYTYGTWILGGVTAAYFGAHLLAYLIM